MGKINCSLYIYRDRSLGTGQLWLESDDKRAWKLPVGKLDLLNDEAMKLLHIERHNPSKEILDSLETAYKFLRFEEFDPEAESEWELAKPPDVEKT